MKEDSFIVVNFNLFFGSLRIDKINVFYGIFNVFVFLNFNKFFLIVIVNKIWIVFRSICR